MARTRTAWRPRRAVRRQPAGSLSSRQVVGLLAALALAVGAVAAAATLVNPNRARSFALIHGSMFLSDDRAPVAIDLATGKPTVRLVGANSQVDAAATADLAVVPLAGGTLLLNRRTGEFNLVDGTGFVVKTTAGGVPLPRQAGAAGAIGVASGNAAYLVRGGPSTSVFLVNAGTVQAANRPAARIAPRASAVLAQPSTLISDAGTADTSPGQAVAADGALWLLTGNSDGRTLHRLTVPPGSATGATLADATRATTSGLAVLAAGPAGEVVLATAGQLQRFTGDSAGRSSAVSGLTGVDQILPATGTDQSSGDQAAFLYHARAGWSLVEATGDGAAVHRLDGIPATAQLAPPATSNGRLYTMDRAGSGLLWQVSGSGAVRTLAGVPQYPTPKDGRGRSLEVADFGDAEVLASRSRVLFNSPNHVLALAVFTDGSRPVQVIDKSSATDLNAAGGASAITARHNSSIKRRTTTAPPKTQVKAPTPSAPAVNTKISCKTTTQIPHVPTITTATSASRSVLLNWNYPLLDSEDCVPSTYQLTVRTLTDGSPAAPGQVTVQGQTSVNLTGLYPSTRYQLTVTAYLNGRGTTSQPVVVTTGPEGPAAPTGLTASTDQAGDWTISWAGCGSVQKGCVPAASWTVIPRFCDGLGLSSPPAPLPVAGDPTLTRFSTSLPGGTALLGRGLSFTVQGTSELGNVGASSAPSGCSYSWAPPDAAAMHLSASEPVQTDLGGTTSSTFTLDLGKNPTAATGGVGGQITFQLLVGGQVVQGKGPSSATSVTFTGIAAGTSYTGRALVAPPRHPDAAVTVGPVSVSTRAAWPQLAVTTAKVSQDGHNPRKGTLTVTMSGLSSAQAGGERFQLTDSSQFHCGQTYQQLRTDSAFDPATLTITADVDLLQYFGDCRVDLQLVEEPGSGDPLVFGGTVSPGFGAPVSMPDLPTGGVSPSDFTAAWDATPDDHGRSTITVTLNSSDPKYLFVQHWSESVSDGDPSDCGTGSDAPPVTLPVDQGCVLLHGGDQHAWTVVLGYRMVGQHADQTVTVAVTGTPPTYVVPTPTPTPTPTSTSTSPSPTASPTKS